MFPTNRQRAGNTVTGYYSLNGLNWTQTARQTIPMADRVLIGLAVCSHDTTQMNESIFDNVSVSTPPPEVSAVLSSDGLTLSWPASAAGFTLESNTNLSLAEGWIPAGQCLLSNSQYFITLPISNRADFYRLHKP